MEPLSKNYYDVNTAWLYISTEENEWVWNPNSVPSELYQETIEKKDNYTVMKYIIVLML